MAIQILNTQITLDLYDYDKTPAKIKTIQLDSKTRYVDAIIQYRGVTYDIGQDTEVVLTVIRPDGTGVQITGEPIAHTESSPEGGAVTTYGVYAEFTPAALAKKGTLKAQFMFTSGEQIIRTEIFSINNGVALDAETSEWAGEYQGYNLDELVQSVNTTVATVKYKVASPTIFCDDIEDGYYSNNNGQKMPNSSSSHYKRTKTSFQWKRVHSTLLTELQCAPALTRTAFLSKR